MSAGSLVRPDASLDDPMVPRFLRVRRALRETADTVTLELDSRDTPAPFAAGQFNMLYLMGAGEVAISISGSPANPAALAHTIRGVGAVTLPLLRARRGDVIGVRGPYGSAWPVQEAAGRDLMLLAGGIGLAPLRPVIYEVLRRRRDFGRLILLYGARTPADLLFRRELAQWRVHPAVTIKSIVDRGGPGWNGQIGVITDLLRAAQFDPARTLAMVCGPEVMMRFCCRDLLRRGVDPRQVYLSMERNMKCAVGFCGHCQFGSYFICRDGPVFRADRVQALLGIREL